MVDVANSMLETGIFRDDLKISKIIPLYKKKGSCQLLESYRPVALIPVFTNIFDKIILQKNSKLFLNKNILTKD